MKKKICLKCSRFFVEDYLYCPYCTSRLQAMEMTESKETIVVPKDFQQNGEQKKHSEEANKENKDTFYDSLFLSEKEYVDEFYYRVHQEFPDIIMKDKKSYICFYREEDLNLPNYGYWFFISKSDGIFALKYRIKPDKTIKPTVLKIGSNSVEKHAEIIIGIIANRISDINTNKEDTFNDKKGLPARSEHKSIALQGGNVEECRQSSIASKRNYQKDPWQENKD